MIHLAYLHLIKRKSILQPIHVASKLSNAILFGGALKWNFSLKFLLLQYF